MSTAAANRIGLPLLYACAIFISAFLLFQVQPIMGKLVLPWFGGSAAVWVTCLLFFQCVLLLGYLYAHGLIRYLAPRAQGWLHLGLMLASLAALPLAPAAAWKPLGGEDPIPLILGLLAASVGLPYLVLSTTGPLLQAWFARDLPGRTPYRLFALSNLGSMLGLLSYPVAFEPLVSTRAQSAGWSAGYAVFVVVCAVLAFRGASGARASLAASGPQKATLPRFADYGLWIALAWCPSVLLLAITAHLTQDLAPVPFLWVLPLALYLLSFILCFENGRWYRRTPFVVLLIAGLAATGYLQVTAEVQEAVRFGVPAFTLTLFLACMVCHGELARLKPHPRFLTGFYLMVSVGGALGGLFVAIIAPGFFNGPYELPIGMVATALLVGYVLYRDPNCKLHRRWRNLGWLVLLALPASLAYALSKDVFKLNSEARLLVRNFYGTLRVTDSADGIDSRRKLVHGVILHGNQFLANERRRWPTTYYGEASGVGLAISQTRNGASHRVGIVGLGAGTLAAYARPGDIYRAYEINPLVREIAMTYFYYLRDAKGAADVVMGDARLSLEREPPQGFDVLAVDAFSSDAIPMHLLTREAFEVYFRHLRADGVLAVHVSNRHLDLAPIVKLAAEYHGRLARLIDSEADPAKGVGSAYWVLVSADRAFFDRPALASVARDIWVAPQVRQWTDDYSSVLPVLRVLQGLGLE
jgi:spermidine synthase